MKEVKPVPKQETEKRPVDNTAVLEKIEAIEKQVGSVRERIAQLEAKKKALSRPDDESMLLQLDANINLDRKHLKKSKKASSKKAATKK